MMAVGLRSLNSFGALSSRDIESEEGLLKPSRPNGGSGGVNGKSILSGFSPTSSIGMIKMAVLVMLLLQNTVYTLLRRYSMANLAEKYDPQEVLLVGEVFKLVFSAFVVATSKEPSDAASDAGGPWIQAYKRRMFYLTYHSGKMFALALIYGAMNILSYVAIRRVDAAVFTVCAQLKILSTATFSVTVLGRDISALKWRSLFQLVLGCVLVTVPQLSPSPSSVGGSEKNDISFILGLAAVLLEVTLSGFASIYFEKVIKASDEKLTVWDRNFQLAMHSIFLYTTYSFVERNYVSVPQARYVPFHDFSLVAWTLAFLGGGGGLLVALTVKYADSVVKTLAVSCAIVTSTLASHYLLGGLLTLEMVMGALIVASSVLNYSFDPTPRTP